MTEVSEVNMMKKRTIKTLTSVCVGLRAFKGLKPRSGCEKVVWDWLKSCS